MNEPQRLFLVQARSDWEVFHALEGQAVCHRLHYLQMCSEKVAKAYFWSNPSAAAIGHAAFTKFVRAIETNRAVASHLGFRNLASFRRRIIGVPHLAYEIERLAPALAGEGPNPEYPWPRDQPVYAPIEQEFAVWARLQAPNGRRLRWLLEQTLLHFDIWF